MSLRPALFGAGSVRRATETERSRPSRPELKLVEGGNAARIERLTPQVRVLSLVAMVAVVLFAVVAFHVVLSQGQFQLEKLQAKADDQQAQYERLRLQVSQLESPERITSEAVNRLGMVPAGKVTPVTPNAGDVPSSGNSNSQGPVSLPTTDDPGSWSKVKPHLSSAAQ